MTTTLLRLTMVSKNKFDRHFTEDTDSNTIAITVIRSLTGLGTMAAKSLIDSAVVDGHTVMLTCIVEDVEEFNNECLKLAILGFGFEVYVNVPPEPELSMRELYEVYNNGDKLSDDDILRFHAHLYQSAQLLIDLGPVYNLAWLRLQQDADTLAGYITARGLTSVLP